MMHIAKRQLVAGLSDARFLFLSLLIILTFISNAFIYAAKYERALTDWENENRDVVRNLDRLADNLQVIVNYRQHLMKPPSALAFIAEGGDDLLPNTLTVNAFEYHNPQRLNRGNDALQAMQGLDWVFIVNTVMSLLAILLGFGTVCGEKRDGTLKLVLTNPVSRLSLFFGKYLGLMTVIVITFAFGVVANLGILSAMGALPLSGAIVQAVGWAMLLSILTLSFVLLISMAASSLTAYPPVSLVMTIILWVFFAIAVPGIAGLVGKGAVDVPNQFEIERDIAASGEEAWSNAPPLAGDWHGDPFADYVRDRCELVKAIVGGRQRVRDAAAEKRIQQMRTVQAIASASPFGALKSGMQVVCQTGIEGFEKLYDVAHQYQQLLHAYAVERDRGDPSTPHLVYSWGRSSDPGTYSRRPVEMSTFPRSTSLWLAGGLADEGGWPAATLLILLVGNALAAIVAFTALARYDPR